VLKLDTVTYGTEPASFLAVRSIGKLLSDFYAGDLISGAIIMDQTANFAILLLRIRHGVQSLKRYSAVSSSYPAHSFIGRYKIVAVEGISTVI